MEIQLPGSIALDGRVAQALERVRKGRRQSDVPFRVEKRASSLPICPRKYYIYRHLPLSKRPKTEDTFISDAATLEGTALHIALQRWFGIMLPNNAYGCWVCRKCKKIKKHKLGIQKCSVCGKEMMYHEYAITKNRKVPFTGHIDMILSFDSYRHNVLVDFKGSSLDKLAEIRNSRSAYPKHYVQVNCYANAINIGGQDLGKVEKINSVVIVYIDRGTPWNWKGWVPIQMPVSRRVYRETMALIKTAEDSLKQPNAPIGVCTSQGDPTARYCEVNQMCFSPLLETLLHDEVYPEDKRPQDRTAERKIETSQKIDEGEVQ